MILPRVFLSSSNDAFAVLYEPRTSMSITALNALAERLSTVARKFPAAPQLFSHPPG